MFLLGTCVKKITGLKLPSNRQALGYFLHLHKDQNNTIREASTMTVEKIEEFWNRARIPTRYKQDCIKKVEVLFQRWQSLKKNSARRTVTQKNNEEEFISCFDDLFDIAHADALNTILIEEDKAFLMAQREKGRRGAMSSVDTVLAKKEKKRAEKLIKEQERRKKSFSEADRLRQQVILESSTSSDTDVTDNQPPCTSSSISSPPPTKRGRNIVLNSDLVSMLDRNKVSTRSAVMVIGAAAKALGHDVTPLTLNKTSIHRQRQQHRKEMARSIQMNFHPDAALIVHWDGKLLQDLIGREKVDRLPILVSSCGPEHGTQLLAVPKLASGTGAAEANAVFEALNNWKVADRVVGMSFDTTSSNTGLKTGACVMLEHLLGTDILHLACRHHILELVAGAAFYEMMGATSAPEILLFKRFQAHWQFIRQDQFQDSSSTDETATAVADIKDDLEAFLISAISDNLARDDYRELLELTLIFIGIAPPRGVRFTQPGAMHQARWMSKVIYTFKVWMFRSQFQLTGREEKCLRELCIFFARVYVRAWHMAPIATAAPNNDLQLLKSLLAYGTVNSAISTATSRKLADHLWYLSEKLVGLAFFDSGVSCEVKDKMVKAMAEVGGEDNPPNRVKLNAMSMEVLNNKSVADFITKNTKSLFTKLRLPVEFLQLPASQWNNDPSYQTAAAITRSVPVINDHAERGVSLIQNYTGRLTKDEEQLQYLLQVVSENRKRYPKALKRVLIERADSDAATHATSSSSSDPPNP